jgi:hypothetical protein
MLGACSKGETTPDQVATTPTTTHSEHSATPGKGHPGGTSIESGGLHLELVPEKEADKTHLDLYLHQLPTHTPIPTAKVIAQIQTPDGKQQSVNMTYAAAEKHYTGIVPGKTAGQYQVKITTDINGKKVDGRFTFDR